MKQVKAIEVSGVVIKMVQHNDKTYQVLIKSALSQTESMRRVSFLDASNHFDDMVAVYSVGN